MMVQVGNLLARVALATDAERAWLAEYLSFEDPRAHFSRGEATTPMYNAFAQAFPAGFVPLVQKAAPAKGFAVQVVDTRAPPGAVDPAADLSWLRDYQLEAVEKVVQKQRGIVQMPTGSGKGELPVALALRVPVRWLFVVHRANLVEDIATRYERRTGIAAGRVQSGEVTQLGAVGITCATFSALYAGMKRGNMHVESLLANTEALFVDEAHCLPAESHYRVAMACGRAYWRVGCSATPLARGDRRSLIAVAALGPVIYKKRAEALVNEGVLARPTIRLLAHNEHVDRPTWQGVYGEAVVRSRSRNGLVVEAVRRAEKPCIVFVKELAHGRAMEKALLKAGVATKFVSGAAPVEARMRAVRDLLAGRFDVVCSTVVFQEGVDVPALRSVVVASGGRSVIATLQRIGRGMRVDAKTGKTTFEVYDILDGGCGCGSAGCRWLHRHATARLKAYVGEGHEVVRVDPKTDPAWSLLSVAGARA